MIKAVKCPRLNIEEAKRDSEYNPVLEVLLRFPDNKLDSPTHILGCPKYDLKKMGCGAAASEDLPCIYALDWKKL